ncbi:integrase core domain-containing protein, partial [Micrococcus sp. SIMBA_131]
GVCSGHGVILPAVPPGTTDQMSTKLRADPIAHVEAATAEWVSWFNSDRIHGSLDDLTPIEVEQLDYAHLG